jgi:hypothetical protein
VAQRVKVSDSSQYVVGGVYRRIQAGRVIEILSDTELLVEFDGGGQDVGGGPPMRTKVAPAGANSKAPEPTKRSGGGRGRRPKGES